MNSSPATPRLLLAAAWIGTAIVAYSIGSLRSPSPALPALEHPAGSASGTAPGIEQNATAADGSERPSDGAHGIAPRSLSEIIGTQPLGDYLKRILSLDDEIKRTTAFLEVLETLKTPEEIRGALDAVAKAGRGWGRGAASREFAMLLQKWTGFDPKGAADYAGKSTDRDQRYMATSAVLRTWGRQDLDGALTWARANGIPASGNPAGQQRNEGEGNYALALLASQVARTDSVRALAIAMEDSDSRTSTRLDDTLIEELFKQHGAEAARDAVVAMPESKLRDAMVGEFADRLAKTDGLAAAKFATSLPPGRGYSVALSEAIAGWAERKPAEAATFLNTIPPSKDSDAARERFAKEIAGKDPLGAIPWAGTITDPRQRQEATETIIRSWVRRDSAAATPWVMQSTAFSDETKQRLLAPETRGRN